MGCPLCPCCNPWIRRLGLPALPFLVKPLQVVFHKSMPPLGNRSASCRVHAIFEHQEFFVEVVDGSASVQIGIGSLMINWLAGRIVDNSALASAISERSGNANRSNRIEPVGILHHPTFQ